MSTSKVVCRGTTDTFVSKGVDLSTSAGLLCYVNTNGKVTRATAATNGFLHPIVEAAGSETNAEVTVCVHGHCFVKAGGTINEGAFLTAETNGKVIATTTLGNYVVGIALHAAATNDEVEILVTPFRYGTYA